jgi:hypothetical protein
VRTRAEAGRCQTLSEVSLILIFHIVLVHYVVVVIIRTTSWCRHLCSLTRVVVVNTLSVFDVAVLVDALNSAMNHFASMHGAAICAS